MPTRTVKSRSRKLAKRNLENQLKRNLENQLKRNLENQLKRNLENQLKRNLENGNLNLSSEVVVEVLKVIDIEI